MNKFNLSKLVTKTQLVLSKHSPEILTGMGIAGMITTTVLAVKATPKAIRIIEENKEAIYLDHQELKPIDAIKWCWKCYIPAAVTGTVSIACLIGASRVSLTRNAALATAYKLSENALTEYREKVIETIGEKKEQTVREAIAKDRIQKNPVSSSEVIIIGKETTLFYDPLSGRYFKYDIEKLRRIIHDLNRQLLSNDYISLNEFYWSVDLPGIELGDTVGWNIEKGKIDISFSAQKTDDDRPCLVLDFVTPPTYNYDR